MITLMEMSNDKTQMSNQIQMLQCQSLHVWALDFDIHLNFGTLAFGILKIYYQSKIFFLRAIAPYDSPKISFSLFAFLIA